MLISRKPRVSLIDTIYKIHKTLASEENQIGKSLYTLAMAFKTNDMLQEFEKLNVEIMERKNRLGIASVYTPFDEKPFKLVNTTQPLSWTTNNPCRLASQVVTGVEMLQMLTILEGIRKMRLNWIPISLHYDGCSLLVDPSTFDENSKLLQNYVLERLLPTQMVPNGLEFSEYEPYVIDYDSADGLKDNRLI